MGLFSSEKQQPQIAHVKGHQLKCAVCRNDYFFLRNFQLNTSWMSFFNLDWLNRSATCFVCSDCGQIIWFDTQGRR